LAQHLDAGGASEEKLMTLEYAVVFERTPNNYSAYVPDLPGCVTTGQTLEEVERNMREAIMFHIESLKEHGELVPEPRTSTGVVKVAEPLAAGH
jgi:predicted RNase H-like HicB family nuclease